MIELDKTYEGSTKTIICAMRKDGKKGKEIAEYLNTLGRKTRTGRSWTQPSVSKAALDYGLKRKHGHYSKGSKKGKASKPDKPRHSKADVLLEVASSNLSDVSRRYVTKLIAQDIANG